MDFASLRLSPALVEVVKELGFTSLTPIQAQSIPLLLKGRDVIGQSKTGSGKTAAFTLPILERVRLDRRQVQALILCPTRELCAQVAREIRKLGRKHPSLQVVVLAGGQPARPQLLALEKGAHIAVGTPGRVTDLLGRGKLVLKMLKCVVLDEADRMLDMGFQEDMETILGAAPDERQTVFFSATFPESIEAMSRQYQKNPARVTIGNEPEAAPAIKEVVYRVAQPEKRQALLWILSQAPDDTTIVFCNHKATVAELVESMVAAGISAAGLHGDLDQIDRDRVLAKFRGRSVRTLVATDVAARGLDVDNLGVVINFDLPHKPEVYVHRIGRTGRAGKSGFAVSMATPKESHKIEGIETYIGRTLQPKSIPADAHLETEVAVKAVSKDAEMATLYIGAGRKDKMRPGDILGALTGEAGGLAGSDVGKIEIHDRFSYVAVAKKVATTALKRLQSGKIKGKQVKVELVR